MPYRICWESMRKLGSPLLGVSLAASGLALNGCQQSAGPNSPAAPAQQTAETPSAPAQPEPPAVSEPRETRVAVGEPAPALRLPDQQGEEHSLEELRKENLVALVFYRSADW